MHGIPTTKVVQTVPSNGLAARVARAHSSARIALYSHDAQGLGHIRRNLLVAGALIQGQTDPSALLLSGLRETSAYTMPRGVDALTLPAFGKGMHGGYYSRSLRLPVDRLARLRRETIQAAIESFEPDVLVVDKLPLGLFDELRPCLEHLGASTGTRIVLGLREILDEPDRVRSDWQSHGYVQAVREFYDRIWIYGDRTVYDTVAEYEFPDDLARMARFTGYLNPRQNVTGGRPATGTHSALPGGSLTLCLIGGGRDGLPIAEAFLRVPLPEGHGAVLVTGPLMAPEDRARLHTLAGGRQDVAILDFVSDPHPLLCCADRVIAMGGYNTVCETLAFQKRTLIIPRVHPRLEQWIRAERFRALGLLDVLHPNDLNPEALAAWVLADHTPVKHAVSIVDFDGLARLPSLLSEVMNEPRREVDHVHD